MVKSYPFSLKRHHQAIPTIIITKWNISFDDLFNSGNGEKAILPKIHRNTAAIDG
jgi:hypothetical protein